MDFRLGTWNVEYVHKERLDVLQRVLGRREHQADIWVLTETHDDLEPPGANFVAHSQPRPKNYRAIRPGSRWVSIWSRFPVIEEIAVPNADTKRTVCALLDLGEGRQCVVYGTVMPWHSDQGDAPRETPVPYWSEHHRVIVQQCAEWKWLRDTYPKAALCVAGDYNTDMATGHRYGTKEGIATLRAGLAACDMFCATEPGRVPEGLLPVPPIDHIALSASCGESTSIVAAWPAFKGVISDHSGLVVRFEL